MTPTTLEVQADGNSLEADIPLVTQDVIGSFPLSFAQEGLWFVEQIAPGTAAYNMPEAWRLTGKLDVRALEASIEQVIRRHESLRTIFSSDEGKAKQIVLQAQPFRLVVRDLSSCTNKEQELERLLHGDARRPSDLHQRPLLRIGLIRLGEEEHVLSINMHHIVSDAWSFGVFLRDLAQCYTGRVKGEPLFAPDELPIQYADFASWQREQFQGYAQELEYWAKQLTGPLPFLTFPTDCPRPAKQSFEGATTFFTLSPSLNNQLKELSRKTGTTLFMTLLAAFSTLLRRNCRQDDIVIGSPIAGRDRAETENLIGMCVNTLPLRLDLSGDPTFLQLLDRIREVTLSAYEHRQVPVEKIVEALQLDRGAGHHPLFQVVFGFQEDFAADWALPGLNVSRIELDSGTAKFDWTLLFTETEQGLRLRFEYSTDLFEEATVLRFFHQFEHLLTNIIARPEKSLSEFELLSPEEKQQMLEQGTQTSANYERNARTHELFESQAKERPDAPALVFEGRQISYCELNARANQLARHLQKHGAAPDSRIGICLERSPEIIISMLAILKAGAAYVPLDRTYPHERIAFMLKDAGVKTVVTNSNTWTEHAAWTVAKTVYLDKHEEEIARESSENFSSAGSAESIAYVIYTSGSTGLPKGTEIPHRGIVRLVRNTNYAEFTANEVFLQLAPITFDASTLEIWGALLNGAKLVIFPPHAPTYEELARTLQQEKVTTLWLTAGLFHQMVDCQLEGLKGVRQLLAGGEALSVAHVVKAVRGLPDTQIINGYGPTENTTFTCCYRIPVRWAGGTSVPIGKPISNTQVYILDEHFRPAPAGVPGELWIGGDGLARGYLNQPELTAKCFIQNPFSAEKVLLYRTGDLVRWLADGNIEFLGRIDEQLKIRGFRVEPGEIERSLSAHPAVAQAVVTAREDQSGTKQLLAYVVAKEGAELKENELRQFLQSKLPAYLLPSRFVQLLELPLTRNGKVDRRALPAPDDLGSESVTRVEPRTSTETALAEIWRELLGRKQLGALDNFFHLGGHSLLATQMISRIARRFRVELPVSAVFEAPTVEGLAQLIEKSEASETNAKSRVQSAVRWRTNKDLLAHLDELSDSEIEELLAETELKEALS